MGRLSGFTADDITRKLRHAGFTFDRQAKGSHEIWRNPETRARTTIPRHPGTLPEGTVTRLAWMLKDFWSFNGKTRSQNS